MGLDMYLYAEKNFYASSWGGEEGKEAVKTVAKMMDAESLLFPGENDLQSAQLQLEIAYWRKANAIHKYFVDKCADGKDECQEIFVDEEKLQELLKLCKQVLENRDLAFELLPTQSGFFFGSIEYDDWYFRDLEYTVKVLEKIIPQVEAHSDWYIYYRASW